MENFASALLLFLLLQHQLQHALAQHSGDGCFDINSDCATCYAQGTNCVWCSGNIGVAGTSPCIPASTAGSCSFLLDSGRCNSQCTADTCPLHSTCTDGASNQPVCTCDTGYRSVDPDRTDNTPGVMCVSTQAGGQVGQTCRDFGSPDDVGFGTPGFDATASCTTLSQNGLLCTSSMSGFRSQVQTMCPYTCHPMCQSNPRYGTCGCTSASNEPCDDFYAINANCPVHALGQLVPAQCDAPGSTIDDQCSTVYVQWYERCFTQLSTTGSLTSVMTMYGTELTSFYHLCQNVSTCGTGCGMHGTCNAGTCVCSSGWRGAHCELQPLPPLPSGYSEAYEVLDSQDATHSAGYANMFVTYTRTSTICRSLPVYSGSGHYMYKAVDGNWWIGNDEAEGLQACDGPTPSGGYRGYAYGPSISSSSGWQFYDGTNWVPCCSAHAYAITATSGGSGGH